MTTPETQAPEQAQQTVRVGFEKALLMMNPNWRTEFTPDQVNLFRHYYHQGIQDMHALANLNYQQSQQHFQAVLNTAIVTGNEERLADLQRQQAEAAAAAANPGKAKKTKKAKTKVPVAGAIAASKGGMAVKAALKGAKAVTAKPVKAPAKAVKAVKGKR